MENGFKAATSVVEKLVTARFEAYLAGGAVRDFLLGRPPKDVDVATSAKPSQVERLFAKTIAVGKAFGVIVVLDFGEPIEVATFRRESIYEQRRPKKVTWTTAREDAKRRDFTINALFYDPLARKILDFVDGQKDLHRKLLRFIGEPAERIRDDPLRILRAVRLKAELGFSYERKTLEALKAYGGELTKVSWERIRDELTKMLRLPTRREAFEDLARLDLLEVILPEVSAMIGVPQPEQFHAEGDVFDHTMLALKALPHDTSPIVAWATLLHDVGKPKTISYPKDPSDRIRFNEHAEVGAEMSREICRRLRFSADDRELISWLVLNHLRPAAIPKMRLAKQRRWLRDERFPQLLEVFRADTLASHPVQQKLLDTLEKLYKEEKAKPEVRRLLSGSEVIKVLKIPEGPKVGMLLRKLEEAQLEGVVETREEAIAFLKSHV